MASYNLTPSNMATMPSTVNRTVGSSGGGGFLPSNRNNIVRVTSVNFLDGSITYEPLENNIGRSYLGSPQAMTAKMLTNTVSSVPLVGELVEIISAPSIDLANTKNQAIYETYYRPVSVDVWQNQNNNVILDPTVQGQANTDPMADLSLENYQNALNGFI